MQKQLLLLLFLPSIIHAAPRIVGGRLANITDVPYQLSLRRASHHVCGATILSPDVAATAAHCLNTPGAYSVKAGVSNLKESGKVKHVKLGMIHPNYDHRFNDYDIALLFLASPFTFSDNIQSVMLPEIGDEHEVRGGMIGRVSGWGVTSSKSKDLYSEELRAVELPVVEQTKCSNIYYNRITTRMFCAGLPEGRKDSCSGDSGGPFVVRGVLYGIVSSGMDCAQPQFPGIYTNVQALRDFFKEYAGL